MTKKDLIDVVSQGSGLYKKDIAIVYDNIFAAIGWALSRGDSVTIPEFGRFITRKRKAEHVKDFKGEEVFVPERILPVFRAADKLKKIVNNVE